MQMVHIYSKFDALLFCADKFKAKIDKVNGYHFELNKSENNIFFVYSASNEVGKIFVNYAININEIILKNNNSLVVLKTYQGVSGHFELMLKENSFPVICQKPVYETNINCESQHVCIKVFKGYISLNSFNFYDSLYNTEIYEIKTKVIKNLIFIRFFSNFSEKIYIFRVIDNFFEKLDEVNCKKFEIENDEIKILMPCLDMHKQGIVKKYIAKDESFVEVEKYFVNLEKDVFVEQSELIIYAFMENVILGNIKLAKSYLDESLSKKLTKQHFIKFFENIVDVEQCKYISKNNLVFAVYKDKVERVPLTFEIVNGKICDIN